LLDAAHHSFSSVPTVKRIFEGAIATFESETIPSLRQRSDLQLLEEVEDLASGSDA
jgi:hypothetical protein